MQEDQLKLGESPRIRQVAFYQHRFGESQIGAFVLRGDPPPGGLAKAATVYKFKPSNCPKIGVSDYREVVAEDGNEDTWMVNALNVSPRCPGCGYIYDLVMPDRFNFVPAAGK